MPKRLINTLGAYFSERLGFRLQIAVLTVIAVVLAIYTAFAVMREEGRARKELTGAGELLAGQLAYSSRIGVFAENREQLKDVTEGVLKEPHVVMAALYNADGKLLYAAKYDGGRSAVSDITGSAGTAARETRPGVRESDDALAFVKPVVLRQYGNAEEALYLDSPRGPVTERTVGYVKVVLEKETLRRETLAILLNNAVIAVIFIVLSAAVVSLQVKKITRPLEALTEQVEALGRGVDVAAIPVKSRDEVGKLAAAFNTMVEERGRAEKALRESEEKYRTLFEESIQVVFISSPAGKILDINPAGVRLFGYAGKDEMLLIDIAQGLYENPGAREKFKEQLEVRGYVKDFPAKLKNKQGGPLDVLISATAVRDQEGAVTAYRGMLRDVTAERNLEDQLRHAQKMEAVGRLTGGIAHDFNNILTAIMSYAYRLQIKLAENEALVFYAAKIVNATEKAANLITSLLTFSRKKIMNFQPVDLNTIARDMQDMLSRVIGEDIELAFDPSPKGLMVTADSGQIEQMLMNFVANARDAMPAGGRVVVRTGRMVMERDFIRDRGFGEPGDYAVLAVADTGTGMSEATRKKIFEPFFTTKEQGKGTGLGLSIVYGIVKQHGGYIEAASEPGCGSTFTVYLPLLHDEEPGLAPEERGDYRGGAETILIAEDDEGVLQIMQSILGEFGYRLIAVRDGEDGLAKFLEHKDSINLLLLDMVMPRKNGLQLYHEIRKIRPGLKTIFTSGYSADNLEKQGFVDGEIYFLTKPVSPRKLLLKVREVLDS